MTTPAEPPTRIAGIGTGDTVTWSEGGELHQDVARAVDQAGVTTSTRKLPWNTPGLRRVEKSLAPADLSPDEPEEETALTPLTEAEAAELERCEQVIAENVHRMRESMDEIGEELGRIKEQKLYKSTHTTFPEYCRAQWNLSKPYAYQLINFHRTRRALSANGIQMLPRNERQVRELAKGHIPEEQVPEIWERAVQMAGGEQPSGAQVRQAADEIAPKPPKPEPVDHLAATPYRLQDWLSWIDPMSFRARTGVLTGVDDEGLVTIEATDAFEPAIVYCPAAQLEEKGFKVATPAVGADGWWIDETRDGRRVRTGRVQELREGGIACVQPTDDGTAQLVMLMPGRFRPGALPDPLPAPLWTGPQPDPEEVVYEAELVDEDPVEEVPASAMSAADQAAAAAQSDLCGDVSGINGAACVRKRGHGSMGGHTADAELAARLDAGNVVPAHLTPDATRNEPVKTAAQIAEERAAARTAPAKSGALKSAEEKVAERRGTVAAAPAPAALPEAFTFRFPGAILQRMEAAGGGALLAVRQWCDLAELTREHSRDTAAGLDLLRRLFVHSATIRCAPEDLMTELEQRRIDFEEGEDTAPLRPSIASEGQADA